MPTYLLHGFRWPRSLIRIHIILQNLEDAAAEWLMAPKTIEAMTRSFKTCYPKVMDQIPNLQFIEQYDPMDERPESRLQPFAYVADVVHEIRLGTDLKEIIGKSLDPSPTIGPLTELRNSLVGEQEMPDISWYVVVCGDTERPAPIDSEDFKRNVASQTSSNMNGNAPNTPNASSEQESGSNRRSSVGKRQSLQKGGDSSSRSGLSGLLLRMRKSSRRSLLSNSSQPEVAPESLCPS